MQKVILVMGLLALVGCSMTQAYVSNISPAGEQGILVEKCRIQFNKMTSQISDEKCQTSYVWLGGKAKGKAGSEAGSNPNNVITIK